MIIKVLRKHIKNSPKDADGYDCPITLAYKEQTKTKTRVFTTLDRIHPTDEWYNDKQAIKLPKEARQFIRDFDKGKEVEPFQFKINLK